MIFGGGGDMIFLDCMLCDESIMLRFDSREEMDAMSNEQATPFFLEAGWTIKPTRCPQHVGQPLPATT